MGCLVFEFLGLIENQTPNEFSPAWFIICAGCVPKDIRDCFGSSNEFIKSISQNDKSSAIKSRDISPVLLEEAHFVASCTYEKGTIWGDKASVLN